MEWFKKFKCQVQKQLFLNLALELEFGLYNFP